MCLSLFLAIFSITPLDSCPCKDCGFSAGATLPAAAAPFVHESLSNNFKVRSYIRRISADAVARLAETQRSHLYCHWREQVEIEDWSPRCEIVIHASRGAYLATVGRGGETSLGSTWLDLRGQRCHGRRIDLLPDAQGNLTALPHELSHVATSDMLTGRVLPRWLDEGVAILADSVEKQRLHERELAQAKAHGLMFRVVELMNLTSYPHASRVSAFYAQSAALTRFLARQGKPSLLLTFAESARKVGYDQALRDTYNIDGVAALERAWIAPKSLAEIPPAITPGRKLRLDAAGKN